MNKIVYCVIIYKDIFHTCLLVSCNRGTMLKSFFFLCMSSDVVMAVVGGSVISLLYFLYLNTHSRTIINRMSLIQRN